MTHPLHKTYDTTHPVVATVDTTTMIDSVQQPVTVAYEKSTQIDRAPRPQTMQDSTQTVQQLIVTTNKKST